jgi:2-polyprenyl-3-methyl-5-hydroxy-6-metoxy-1,4-benzoquinol methylase
VTPQFYQHIYELRPWFHDFSPLGIQTSFQGPLTEEIAKWVLAKAMRVQTQKWFTHVNQQNKEAILLPFLERAIEIVKGSGISRLSVLDMFCSDGYYAFWAKKMAGDCSVTGIDWTPMHIKRCSAINEILNYQDINFRCMDVFDLPPDEPYDIVLCAGGLYHVSDPQKLLRLVYQICKRILVVQSLVTLETEDENYFVKRPWAAPEWLNEWLRRRHFTAPALKYMQCTLQDCRFTDAKLKKMLLETGWTIVDHQRNELEGILRLDSRGSSYFLCKKS